MKRKIQSLALVLVASILTAMVWPLTESAKIVEASPIKNWTSNEYIRYSDLNANFNHLHANLGHGHGAIITASDIATNAGIRPEQTTFGAGVIRALVAEGTWQLNADAGTLYVPRNTSGTLAITVSKVATGYSIAGAAETGANPDGGSSIYTVITSSVDLGGPVAYTAHVCYTSNGSTALTSPLAYSMLCQTVASFGGAAAYTSPTGVYVAVYNNKVQ